MRQIFMSSQIALGTKQASRIIPLLHHTHTFLSLPTSILTVYIIEEERQKKKAKVVAAVWGTEFIKFLATLAILQ